MSRQVITALTALSVLLASGAAEQLRYLCRMSGEVVTTCCCPSEREAHEAKTAAVGRDDGCCDPFLTDADRQLATTGADALRVLPTPLFATLPVVFDVASAEPRTEPRLPIARGPPPRGKPALFAMHCRYLI
jgi:hypothetical protein